MRNWFGGILYLTKYHISLNEVEKCSKNGGEIEIE